MSILSTLPDKRRRRTNAEIVAMREQMHAILKEDHPQSVRHVFYRMTDPRLQCHVEKSERGYRHVQHQLAEMRKDGALPYGWITDATRSGFFVDTFDGPADFISRVSGLYRADAWKHADAYVEIWVESRSIAGVIRGVCNDLGVSLYPAGGFTSLTLSYEAAGFIDDALAGSDKTIEILYIGDFDPAGVMIDRDIEAKLRGHLRARNPLTFHRIGINQDQIAAYDLPTKPRKVLDRRALHMTETVEAEALPAHVMRALLRDKIESYLPEQALRVAKVAERSERDFLLRLASALGSANA